MGTSLLQGAGEEGCTRREDDGRGGGGPGHGAVTRGEGLDGHGHEEDLERDQDDEVDEDRVRGAAGTGGGRPHGLLPSAQMVPSRISSAMRPSGRVGGPEITAPVRASKLPSWQ